jgi:hypothetical protein
MLAPTTFVAVAKMTSTVTGSPSMSAHPRMSDFPSRARIVASILLPVAWLCFTLLYVGFWAQGFSLFQSVIVILVSIILLAGTMAALWVSWGMRHHSWAWDE